MKIKNRIDDIVSFIRKCAYSANMKSTVIGISGGIDSAVVATLCSEALGRKNVYGILMPYGRQSDIEDSKSIIKKLKINKEEINIEQMVIAFEELYPGEELDQIRYGNIKARVRMICLYDRSKKYKALVAGTCNKSELLMGYFTLHGDGACDYEPISHLYKTEVVEIAKYLDIPDNIINKPPSAGLWDGQTDADEMGHTYEEMDRMFMLSDCMSWKTKLPQIME